MRSSTLCTVLSRAEKASLKKQMTTLAGGSVEGYTLSRHLQTDRQTVLSHGALLGCCGPGGGGAYWGSLVSGSSRWEPSLVEIRTLKACRW